MDSSLSRFFFFLAYVFAHDAITIYTYCHIIHTTTDWSLNFSTVSLQWGRGNRISGQLQFVFSINTIDLRLYKPHSMKTPLHTVLYYSLQNFCTNRRQGTTQLTDGQTLLRKAHAIAGKEIELIPLSSLTNQQSGNSRNHTFPFRSKDYCLS
jgi:hypothetical protein